MGLASVEPTAKQNVGPDQEPPIGLVSDFGLRGMIEAWFELERLKSNLVSGPDTARMLKRCEVRIRAAIMHLGSETVTESMAAADRSGGCEAVRALWMEAVAQGKAETIAALRSFHSFALSHWKSAWRHEHVGLAANCPTITQIQATWHGKALELLPHCEPAASPFADPILASIVGRCDA
jgi:hypothetical protein